MNYKIEIPGMYSGKIRNYIMGAKAIQRMAKRELDEDISFDNALLCAILLKIDVAEKIDISEDNYNHET